MFQNILEQFKKPVTSILEQSQNESLKSSSIKSVITALILSIISLISTVITILTMYSSKYSYLSEEYISEQKKFAFENAKLFQSFLTDWLTFITFIAIIALLLLIIAKALKCEKTYSTTLSMVSNTSILYAIGTIVATILYYIYAPLGLLVSIATVTYSALILINSFRDSLDIENTDKLVQISTLTLICVVIIFTLVIAKVTGISLKDISDLNSFLETF